MSVEPHSLHELFARNVDVFLKAFFPSLFQLEEKKHIIMEILLTVFNNHFLIRI